MDSGIISPSMAQFVQIKMDDPTSLVVINIYAPTYPMDRRKFWKPLASTQIEVDQILFDGGFNMVENTEDRQGGSNPR